MSTPVSETPFAVLTLIAAPAVFTNASSVLALGTGNRLARVVDRTLELAHDVHDSALESEDRQLRVTHLSRLKKRGALLVRALSFFYGSIGAFAAASLVSILGAVLVASGYRLPSMLTELISFVAGALGFVALSVGCTFLVTETRMALQSVNEEAELARKRYELSQEVRAGS
jgi:hypothetical protein